MIAATLAHDWSRTPLGPMDEWPDSLRAAVSICLHSSFPMVVLCGPTLIYLYNDANIRILGGKHPAALGRPVHDVVPEVWHEIEPRLKSVLSSGVATSSTDLLLALDTRGFLEERYFTFSYSPVIVSGRSVEGVFVTALETTDRVLGERRLRALNELATQVARARTAADPYMLIERALSGAAHEIPFAALYRLDDDNNASLLMCSGLDGAGRRRAQRMAAGAHPAVVAACRGESRLFDAGDLLDDGARVGIWPEQPSQAIALPVAQGGSNPARHVLLAGISPRIALDARYTEFFEFVARHVGTAIADAERLEAERRSLAAMQELARSKTRFFANASHELRTPVTLILGALEDIHALEANGAALRDRLDMARRNARRLHRLVNAVMDFASIEAGRLAIQPEPTGICALTLEIAGLFRSAMEAAGLEYAVRCEMPERVVAIDREMWEKVMLNLISNAFKFTRAGRIEVRLDSDGGMLRLVVRDTGAGIAQDDLPHVFERFFRGRPVGARSAEGSGIGLALASELVRLHGGSIDVESRPGAGSAFTVRIPAVAAAPDAQAVAPPARAAAAAEEVRRVAESPAASPAPAAAGDGGRIDVLVVDDNDDIVRYIARLLAPACSVRSAADGHGGLAAMRAGRPDLVLLDVMMPGLDGFSLLRAIRADPELGTVSVIVLSASGGEEARLEALNAGADDYVVKPFSGRELTARVHTHIELAKLRRAAAVREGELLGRIAEVEHDLDKVLSGTREAYIRLDRNLRVTALNDAAAGIVRASRPALLGSVFSELFSVPGSRLEAALRAAMAEQSSTSAEHYHPDSDRWFHMSCIATPDGAIAFGNDITERKQAEAALMAAHAELENRVAERTRALRATTALLAAVFDHAPGGIAITDLDGRFIRANTAYQRLVGYSEYELLALGIGDLTLEEDFPATRALLRDLRDGRRASFEIEVRYRTRGRTLWLSNFVSTIGDEHGRPTYFVKIVQDISARKRVEREILSSQEALRTLYERLQTVREEERLSLAREVHDQLGQVLSAAKIDIKLLEDRIRPQDAPLSRRRIVTELRSASRTLEEAIGMVRRIATDLRALDVSEQGLYAAIQWHARDFERRTRVKCSIVLRDDLREPGGEVATTLFRIFQEAMTNVLRHAKATRVVIELARRGNAVLLRVCDDGAGIPRDRARSARAIGLAGIRERAALARGRALIGPLRPHGTLVSARIPLTGENAAGAEAIVAPHDAGEGAQA